MKSILEKVGYSLVIFGFIIFIIKFKVSIFYLTDYLVNGKEAIVLIESKKTNHNFYTYECILKENHEIIQYTSFPSTKNLSVGDKVSVLISPTFKVVLLGKFVLTPYVLSIVFFLFFLLASILAGLRLLNYRSISIFGIRILLDKSLISHS